MSINELGKEQGNPGKDMTARQAEKAVSLEGKAEGSKSPGAAPKKKLVAVYRPQNSQQIKSRPAGQKGKNQPAQEGKAAGAPKAGAGTQQERSGRNQAPIKTIAASEKPVEKTAAEKSKLGLFAIALTD